MLFRLLALVEGKHLFDALGRRRPAREDDEDARNAQHGVEHDDEVRQKTRDVARLGGEERPRDDDGDEPQIEDERRQRIGKRHHPLGAELGGGEVGGNAAELFALVLRLGERLDDADARDVLLHGTHHAVAVFLHGKIHRDALPRDEKERHRDDGDDRNEHERQPRVEQEAKQEPAREQDGRAYPHAHGARHHLIDVVGIGREAGDERRHGELIHLTALQVARLAEEIVPQRPRHRPRDERRKAVGGNVAEERQEREKQHRPARDPDGGLVLQGRQFVDDIGEQIGKDEFGNTPRRLQKERERRPPRIRLQIAQRAFHFLPSI